MPDTIDLKKSITADLDQHRVSLKRWKTGLYSIGEKDLRTGKMRDLTQEHIEHLERIIAELERVLAHLEK